MLNIFERKTKLQSKTICHSTSSIFSMLLILKLYIKAKVLSRSVGWLVMQRQYDEADLKYLSYLKYNAKRIVNASKIYWLAFCCFLHFQIQLHNACFAIRLYRASQRLSRKISEGTCFPQKGKGEIHLDQTWRPQVIMKNNYACFRGVFCSYYNR